MIVNISLNLPKNLFELSLRYNTFEKVSYDKYFIASILSETTDKDKARVLIDSITGKGSLNRHFHNLYQEVSVLSENDIVGILKSSLYPVTKLEMHKFIYIPLLNISIFNQRVYLGNLIDNNTFPKTLVEENGTYVSHQFNTPELKIKADTYDVSISDDEIKIKIYDKYYSINPYDFQSIILRDDLNLSSYQGEIHPIVKGDHWIQLSKLTLNNMLDAKDYYYENGDHYAIYTDYIKKSSIAHLYGIYWVKEVTLKYQDKANQRMCIKVSQKLMESGRINEMKNSFMLNLLKNLPRDNQQVLINYVLSKKDSKDLALNGLYLMDKGYEKDWSLNSLKSFFKFHESDNQLLSLYRIHSDLGFKEDDLLKIDQLDKTILNNEHKTFVETYKNDINKLEDNINKKIGEIFLSGIRDNIGKMPLNEGSKELRKYLTDIAHYQKDLKNMNLSQIKLFEAKLNEKYQLFLIVKKRYDEYVKKKI